MTFIKLKFEKGKRNESNFYMPGRFTWSLEDYPYPAILLVTIEKNKNKILKMQ